MELKSKRKRRLVVVLTGITGAAAIAVPLALAFGLKSSEEAPAFEASKQTKVLDIAWGADPKQFPVEPLPSEFNAAHYGAGAYYGTNFEPRVTEIGADGRTITF